MHRFRPNVAEVKQQIISFHISIRLLFGVYDKIILSKRGEQFRQGIENDVQLHIIKAGHQLLKEKYGDIIVKQFYE